VTLWEAVHTTLETSEEVSIYIACMSVDELLDYVELLEQQRKEQEAQIQDKDELPSDSLIERLKQLRHIDRLIAILKNKIYQRQESPSGQSKEKRTPMEMVRSEYKGMKLPDIAEKVLRQNSRLLTTTELTHFIYETTTDDEFDRARNSLSSELRSGVKAQKPRWRKVGRNAYALVFKSRGSYEHCNRV
jgi:hypothetical protein